MLNAKEWTDASPRPWSGDEKRSKDVPASHKRSKKLPSNNSSSSSSNNVPTTSFPPQSTSRSNSRNTSPQRQSRKSSRSNQSRDNRDKQRLENLIGREYSLVNDGDAMSVRVSVGARNGQAKTSSKIWIEDKQIPNVPHEYEDDYSRRSRAGSPNSKLSSREVHFDSRASRDNVLFSRERTANSPQTNNNNSYNTNTNINTNTNTNNTNNSNNHNSSSSIAANNVVQQKRSEANRTAKLFQQQVDRLSMNTEKTQKKYGKWKPDTLSPKKYSSLPRKRERLTTPLSGSGLMGAELEKQAVDVVLSRHSSTNHQRIRNERQQQQHRILTHDSSDHNNATNNIPLVPTLAINGATKSTALDSTIVSTAASTAAAHSNTNNTNNTINMKKEVHVISSSMDMNVSSSPTKRKKQSSIKMLHPGQATFIKSVDGSHTKPQPQPSLSIGTIRGGKTPAMGEYYKSKTHNLAMLKRTMNQKDIATQPLTLSPGKDPRAYQGKPKKNNNATKKKNKYNYNDPKVTDSLLRPKGWSSPQFMLPAKSKSSPSCSNPKNEIMTPRSKKFVESLGGKGLLGATERALKRNTPFHSSGSLESGATKGKEGKEDDENKEEKGEGDTSHIHSNVHGQHHDEESAEYSQFRTVSTATKFWLQHMLREHNLRKGVTADLPLNSNRPKTPAVKNLSQFLSSAIEHIRWSCTAAGWDAPKQKDLERRVYNVVLDELSDQVRKCFKCF